MNFHSEILGYHRPSSESMESIWEMNLDKIARVCPTLLAGKEVQDSEDLLKWANNLID